MPKCIFCKTEKGPFGTKEHILPESLGGKEWAILPRGLFCDSCQNRFGSHIEKEALGDYPFSYFRTLIGIPTKKGKAPWFNSFDGKIIGSPIPGEMEIEPLESFRQPILQGKKTKLLFVAETKSPEMVCRVLLKMGLEIFAANDPYNIFDKRFDPARNFSLMGVKDNDWWYLQYEDINLASFYFTNGVTARDWFENVRLEVVTIRENAQVFHLKLLYLDFLVPLEQRIMLPFSKSENEPYERVYFV